MPIVTDACPSWCTAEACVRRHDDGTVTAYHVATLYSSDEKSISVSHFTAVDPRGALIEDDLSVWTDGLDGGCSSAGELMQITAALAAASAIVTPAFPMGA